MSEQCGDAAEISGSDAHLPEVLAENNVSSGGAPPSTSAFIFGSHPEGTGFTFGSPALGSPFTNANGEWLGGCGSSVGQVTSFTFGASPTKSVPPASSAVSGTKAAVNSFGCLSSSKDFVFAAPPLVGFQTDFSGTTRELLPEPVPVPAVTSAAAPECAFSTKPVPVITSIPDAPLPDITLASTIALPAMEDISLSDEQVDNVNSSETIPIRKADIPTYLHNSEFYRSLQDGEVDDETILMPSDCMKKDDTVINNDDLRSLLLTLRFWVADWSEFDTILEYVLRQPFESYEKIVSAFYEDFPILKHLKSLTMTTEPVRPAIASGDLQLVQYFLNRGGAWPSDAVDTILQVGNVEMLKCALQAGCEMCRYTSCTAAAGQGFLSCLRVVHEHGARWDQRTTAAAARGGHLECLQYAHENGCPWCDEMRTGDEKEEEEKSSDKEFAYDSDDNSDDNCEQDGDAGGNYQKNEGRTRNTCLMAAAHAQLDCLKYAHNQGVGLPRGLLKAAASHPRGLECLQYAHQQGLRLTSGLCASAVSQKNLPMLKYLLENGCPCNRSAFIAAVRAKNYEFLTFLKENVGEFGSSLCQYAAGRGDVNTVLYLLRNGCPPSGNMWSLTGDKFYQVLQCFKELALPWSATPEASSYVAMTGNTEHMKRLFEAGCPWHPETTMQCARKNLPVMMEFVHENGCPWHPLTCENAAQAGAIDCLKYAYTHGAVIHPELCRRLLCVLPGDSAGLTRECVHCVKLNGDGECIPPAAAAPIPVLAQTSAPKRRILKVMKKTTV